MSRLKQGVLAKQAVTFTVNKAAQLEHGVVEAIIATEDLDRHAEHMSVKGIETPRSNYKAYYNHSYSGPTDLPVGLITNLKKSAGKLIGTIKLAVNEYPFAEQLYKLIQGGYVDSMSIGFIPKEWDEATETWTKSEFVEASFVAEPANVFATVTAKGLDKGEAEKLFELEKGFKTELKTHENAANVQSITESLSVLSLTDLKAVIDNARNSIGELEALVNNPNPTATPHKTLIKLRIAGKNAAKATEQANKAIKIKLRVKPQ